jgi:hypothetical protein
VTLSGRQIFQAENGALLMAWADLEVAEMQPKFATSGAERDRDSYGLIVGSRFLTKPITSGSSTVRNLRF